LSDVTKAESGVEEALRSVDPTAAKAADPGNEATPKPADAAAAPSGAPEAPPAAEAAPAAAPEPPAAPAAEAAKRKAAPVVLAEVSATEAQGEIKKLREQLLEARQNLRQREAELEMSQGMSRDTLAKLKDQHERTLRAVADLENHKKRVVREREETAKFGQEKLLKDFLPVLDNFDRALEHAKAATDLEAVKSGVAMVKKLFEDTLGRHGVKGFSAMGQPFDPRLHEAIQTVESDTAPGTVVTEVVRGFMLYDRLMRPAMVGVAKPKTQAPQAASEAGAVTGAAAGVGAPAESGQQTPQTEPSAEGASEPTKS